jgi:hypothetical protein
MGMNSKDIITFFALAWFLYFFYKYLFYEKNIHFNLFFSAFFVGFGCGVRIAFLGAIFPIFIIGLFFLFKNSRKTINNLIKQVFLHSILAFIIVIILTVICWPHVYESSLSLLFDNLKNSFSFSFGPKLGLINGIFYETKNTPTLYFFYMLKFKIPFFISFLILSAFALPFLINNPIKKIIGNFNVKFFIVNCIIFFPIIFTIFFSVKIYDDLRLFIFIIPFLSLLCAFSLYYFFISFKKSFISKLLIFFTLFLFIIFFFRFISLSPYQYTYINYSYPDLKKSINKFEHDYWGTSFKELVIEIKNKYSEDEINKFKFSVCGGDEDALKFYLTRYLNISKVYNFDNSTHVIMTNRASFNVNEKITCFNKYPGIDLIAVTRNNLLLSVLRKKIN